MFYYTRKAVRRGWAISLDGKRTDWNEVDHEGTRSTDVNRITRRLVTVDNERVRNTLYLMPICDIQYDTANWTMLEQIGVAKSAERHFPYQIYANVSGSTKGCPRNKIAFVNA